MIAVPDHLQAFQRKVLVDRLKILRTADDQVSLASGRDRLGFGAKLFDYALDDAVNHADRAIVETTLHAGDRIGSDHVLGRPEVDEREASGTAEQRVDGDADAHA